MHRIRTWFFLAIITATLALPIAAQQNPSRTGNAKSCDAFVFVQALNDAGARHAWSGFDPTEWPVAVYDGTRTLLFHHPTPPPEFAPLPGSPGVVAMSGRHPAVVGNSVREIGGVSTGTIVPRPGRACEDVMLAVVEELFHVFWMRRHTNYRPNELVRYTYPVKDARNLRRILAEDEALARALEATRAEQMLAWAAAALQIRAEREALLRPEEREWELGTEMLEGPANYVARVVVGQNSHATVARLRNAWTPDEIRWRYYNSGTTICFLLDRLQPRWKEAIDADIERTIVSLLDEAVARSGTKPAAFSKGELSRFEKRAAATVAALSARQKTIRAEVLERAGARIVIEVASEGEPLRVVRFDPVNLLVIDGNEVLHPGYLTLSSGAGTVEVTNPSASRGSYAGTVALTCGAGGHPLRDGIRSVMIAGVRVTPRVDHTDGTLKIEAEGIAIALRGATLRTDGATLRVTLKQQ